MLRAVIEDHVVEAATAYLLRERLAARPDTTLVDLGVADERVDAHLDALRLAGPPAARLALRAVDAGDAGDVFVLVVLACEHRERTWLERATSVLDRASDARDVRAFGIAVARAIAFASPVAGEWGLEALAHARSPVARAAGIYASAERGVDPGAQLDVALVDDAAVVRASALRAAGVLGSPRRGAAVRASLDDEAPLCRLAAGVAATRLGDAAGAAPVLARIARDVGSPLRGAAARAAVRALSPVAATVFVRGLAEAGALRVATIAAGVTGDVTLCDDVVTWARDDASLARVAGQAVSLVTGISIDGALAVPTPRRAADDDPDDEVVALDPDHDLAWPDLDALTRHVIEARTALPRDVPLLLGRAREPAWLAHVLRTGGQRARAEAAHALAAIGASRPAIDVQGRAADQASRLAREGAS